MEPQRDLGVVFFAGLEPPEAAERLADTETVLAYAFGVTFTDRWPVPVGSTRHHIRTAVLQSGLTVDLVALAEQTSGPVLATAGAAA